MRRHVLVALSTQGLLNTRLSVCFCLTRPHCLVFDSGGVDEQVRQLPGRADHVLVPLRHCFCGLVLPLHGRLAQGRGIPTPPGQRWLRGWMYSLCVILFCIGWEGRRMIADAGGRLPASVCSRCASSCSRTVLRVQCTIVFFFLKPRLTRPSAPADHVEGG